MKFALNTWVYMTLRDQDIDKLKQLEERLTKSNNKLADILDRRAKQIISKMDAEHLEMLEAAFPDVLHKVPFEYALHAGNIRLLQINRVDYFKAGWEKHVGNMLFINSAQRLNVSNLLNEDSILVKWADVLEWIQREMGYLPDIDGMKNLCSQIESVIYGRHFQMEKTERKNVLTNLKRIRKMTGENNLYINHVGMCKSGALQEIEYDDYERVIVELSKLESENSVSMGSNKWYFYILLEKCNLNKLEIRDPEYLLNKDFLDQLLESVEYEDEIQKKVCELYRQYSDFNKLYEALDQELVYTGAFSIIIQEYYRTAEEQDAILGNNKNAAQKDKQEDN